MYRILIVDDEPWVVRSIQDSLDWGQYGFAVAATAADGQEALQSIAQLHPDVVLTDIRMPVMGGLELMEKAREQWPSLEFVVLSGYAEFEYARGAMAWGAAGYCLKPVDEREIAPVLREIRKRLDKRRADGLLRLLEEGDDERFLVALEQSGEKWGSEGMRVVRNGDRGIFLGSGAALSLIRESETTQVQPARKEYSAGISQVIHSPGEFDAAATEAQVAQMQAFLSAKPGVFVYSTKTRSELRRSIDGIAAAFAGKDPELVEQLLESLCQRLQSGGYNIVQATYCYSRLCDLLDHHAVDHAHDDIDSISELTQSFADVNAMFAYLEEQFSQYLSGIVGESRKVSTLVRNILRELEQRYCQDISLVHLADAHHVSPSHLSRVFKRETGKTLTEYLAQMRLQKARELLTHTKIPVAGIAEQCGYDDYFYFARLFKRSLGITPSQCREGIEPSGCQ